MPHDSTSDMRVLEGNKPMSDTADAVYLMAYKVPTVTKAASYTCKVSESGTHFIASASATFTLPAVTNTGCEYWFASSSLTAAVTIAGPAVDTLIVFNDLAADTIAADQVNMMTGFILHAICTGTKWLVTAEVGNILQVLTIAT